MWLPFQGFDDLVDGGTLGSAQHCNELCLLAALPGAGRLRLLGFGCLRARIRFGLDLGRCRICRIGFSIFRLVARIDAERGECGLGGNERHATALLVMPPDGVVVLGAHLFDQVLLEQALEDVAGGIALELGGDWKHAPVGALAGGGENDELRIGQA